MQDYLDILTIIIMCVNTFEGIGFFLMSAADVSKNNEENASDNNENDLYSKIFVGNSIVSFVLSPMYLIFRWCFV